MQVFMQGSGTADIEMRTNAFDQFIIHSIQIIHIFDSVSASGNEIGISTSSPN